MSIVGPAIEVGKRGLGVGREAVAQGRKLSIEMLGYDFGALAVKLTAYYAAAFLIAKYFEAMAFGTGLLSFIINKKPLSEDQKDLTQKFMDFVTIGYKGVKFWDAVHVGALILVLLELYLFDKNNKQLGGRGSPFTYGILVLVAGFFAVVVIGKIHKAMSTKTLENGNVEVSSQTGAAGDKVSIVVRNMKPLVPIKYGWNEFPELAKTGTTLSGVFQWDMEILPTTQAGKYTIYFDQTAGGGPRYTIPFTVTVRATP